VLSVDPNALPKDIDQLQKLVAELCERLKHETSEKDKYRSLLRELLDAERNRKSNWRCSRRSGRPTTRTKRKKRKRAPNRPPKKNSRRRNRK
jgi:hypothetical protein